MIVRGESTIIDYHAPFDQGLTTQLGEEGPPPWRRMIQRSESRKEAVGPPPFWNPEH